VRQSSTVNILLREIDYQMARAGGDRQRHER
jgi:hypothetical protein